MFTCPQNVDDFLENGLLLFLKNDSVKNGGIKILKGDNKRDNIMGGLNIMRLRYEFF